MAKAKKQEINKIVLAYSRRAGYLHYPQVA